MNISYAITVCNELDEIKRLLPFLIEKKSVHDEIVMLYDERNGSQDVLDYLLPYNVRPNVQVWRNFFDNDFATAKNRLNGYCKNPWIFQLDADEMISEFLVEYIGGILESNSEADIIYVPRINIVNGITEQHVKMWNWNLNDKGWINFPDYQGRIYRNNPNIKWHGKVHEKIVGATGLAQFPLEEEYCIMHVKDISRQEKQNKLYQNIT